MEKAKSQQKDDDQVKKFLNLVKQAQNEALIGLIADGLKNELQNQKIRVTHLITDFLRKDLVKENSEFTRLKVAEGLLPILSQVDIGQELFETRLNTDGSTFQKQIERLERSPLVVRISEELLSEIQIDQIASSVFLQRLIQEYQPLLANLNQEQKEEQVNTQQAQQNTKQRLKSVLMGELENVKSIKLSDFIDEKFLEQVDETTNQVFHSNFLKKPLSELTITLEQNATQIFQHHSLKRQKCDQTTVAQFLIFTPYLAILTHQVKQLLSPDYKKRQAAANQLRHILKQEGNFNYSVISTVNEEKFTIQCGYNITKQKIAQVILPRLLFCMLKDNFCDFEGLKVLAPVREEALRLLSTITPLLTEEVQKKLLTMLPNIFREVERDVWHSKLNFFLILKGIVLNSEKWLKEQVLQIFGQLLIVAIPSVEDEPKVAITELLQILLPVYLQSFNSPKIPTKTFTLLLDNLTQNLQKADEIEASAIAVFNLVCKIFDLRTQHKCLADFKYNLNLNVFAPFNFHRLEPVRRSYNELMLLVLRSGSIKAKDDLTLMLTLTIQSIIMENNEQLINVLYQSLQLIVDLLNTDDLQTYFDEYLMQDNRLPEWIDSIQLDFSSFMFVQSSGFQSINNDYFNVVFRPSNDTEWETFFNQKTNKLTHAITLLLSKGKCTNQLFDAICRRTQVIDQQPDGQAQVRTVLNQSMLHLMIIIEQYIRQFDQKLPTAEHEVIEFEYLQGLASQLLNSEELDVSISTIQQTQQFGESLNQFVSLAETTNQKYLVDLGQFALTCVSEFVSQQTFRSVQEPDFNGLIDQIGHYTAQTNNQQLSQAYFRIFNSYQSILLYVQNYSLRLKASSAGILLGIARLHQDVTDQQQSATYLHSILNTVTKPILMQLNSENILVYKNLTCQSVTDLVLLLDRLKLWTPLKLVFNLVIKMIHEGFEGQTNNRDESMQQLFDTIFKATDNIYVSFRGILGANALKPDQFKNSTDVKQWLKLVQIITNSQRAIRPGSQSAFQAQNLLCKLLDQAFSVGCDLIPQFVEKIFYDLTSEQQNQLLTSIVQKMNSHSKTAFDSLDALLDSQIKNQREKGFLDFLPIFILPVIKSIQLQSSIYESGDFRIMKILAKIIQILPLNIAQFNHHKIDDLSLNKQMQEGLDFIKVFAANEIIEGYEIVIPVAAKFRTYQLEGINWMAKLGSYNLNCALCDDMGLGKTLQSLTVVLNESAKRKQKAVNLVVCPTSLTYNWLSEIKKFFKNVKAEVIESSNSSAIISSDADILIINYEKVKSHLSQLQSIPFFYIVLDEAHKIKNSKSVVTQSINKLKSERKIALSGTPLQNKVAELWSLFDFLMPNFLEDESTFNKIYNKYLTGNIKKMQEKLEETQQFVNALKSLKRRIAPFILRRTKEQVLKELPPKVIQDYECIMPNHQYQVHQIIEKTMPFQSVIGKQTNSLQNLITHRKVCNHPILVKDLLEDLPQLQSGYQHSAKLLGLIEILQECEILQQQAGEEENIFSSTQPHRALIFCQMQSFLKLVESDVIQHFGVKYLQLTGSMSSKERVETVDLFNSDQSYKVLLLTTAVGGLGLTLTGADIVIFVEHDWNPMKDLQAMDRAHRIGQTRTVNVYRLIVKDTIEEKIMSLQRFKENLAKSLIQNRSDQDSKLIAENQLDLSDLLKSFEEHSIYQKQTAVPAKQSKESKKPLTLAQVIAQEAIDQEVASIQKACEGADFEKL